MVDIPPPCAPKDDLAALLGEYLPILSHDVRTPMTAIKGAAGVLAAGLGGALSEHQMRLVNICQRNADLVTLLVQDVVELLRLRTGQAETHPTEFDMLAEARETWSELGAQTNLPVVLESDATALPFRTDRHYLRRAIGALIRFPQSYAAVKEESLSFREVPGGAEILLTCAPISRDEAKVDTLLSTTVRGQRQLEGRLHVTGLELPFLDALSAPFSTKLAIETPSPSTVQIRLLWPPLES